MGRAGPPRSGLVLQLLSPEVAIKRSWLVMKPGLKGSPMLKSAAWSTASPEEIAKAWRGWGFWPAPSASCSSRSMSFLPTATSATVAASQPWDSAISASSRRLPAGSSCSQLALPLRSSASTPKGAPMTTCSIQPWRSARFSSSCAIMGSHSRACCSRDSVERQVCWCRPSGWRSSAWIASVRRSRISGDCLGMNCSISPRLKAETASCSSARPVSSTRAPDQPVSSLSTRSPLIAGIE